MGDLAPLLGIGALVLVGLAIFIIYFIFKALQFVIQAINLYKKIIKRQDEVLGLLLDIRDKTTKFDANAVRSRVQSLSSEDESFICEECKAEVLANAKTCPKCGAQFE